MNPDNPEVGSLSYMAPELLSGIKIYFYIHLIKDNSIKLLLWLMFGLWVLYCTQC